MSSRRIDLTGMRFERLVVVAYNGDGRWAVVCDCGQHKVVLGANLRRNLTRSCGCLLKDFLRAMDRSAIKRREKPAADFRTCSTCKVVKAASEFSPKRGQCKDCIREYMLAYAKSPAARDAQHRYRMAHPKPPKPPKPPKSCKPRLKPPTPPRTVLTVEERRVKERVKYQEWVARHPDYASTKSKAFRRRHPEKHREKIRNWLNRNSKELGDEYVKRSLCKSNKNVGGGLPRQLITPELIELKREQLVLYRIARELKQATTKEKP